MSDDNRVWKPNRQRFVVDDDMGLVSEDRVFKNGKTVHNQILGFSYSVDEIVEVLNEDYFRDYLFELLQEKIWYCQAKFNDTGDKKYAFLEEELKKLRDECYNYNSIFKYSDFLEERFNERIKKRESK